MTEQKSDEYVRGVSIITCTNKLCFMENIFENYMNQDLMMKELIVILNNNELNIEEWKKRGEEFNNVSIFQLPEEVPLGTCLNFGVKKAKFEYIAKFDDDDYYASAYLSKSMFHLLDKNAHIVGKRSYYIYLVKNNLLMIRFPNHENRWVKRVHGGTILAKKEVFNQVPFPDISIGEDKYFFKSCILEDFRIYSTSRFHYTYLRRDQQYHTWKAKMGYLFRTSKKIFDTTDYKKYANPSIILRKEKDDERF